MCIYPTVWIIWIVWYCVIYKIYLFYGMDLFVGSLLWTVISLSTTKGSEIRARTVMEWSTTSGKYQMLILFDFQEILTACTCWMECLEVEIVFSFSKKQWKSYLVVAVWSGTNTMTSIKYMYPIATMRINITIHQVLFPWLIVVFKQTYVICK